jgi:hypothetical protein
MAVFVATVPNVLNGLPPPTILLRPPNQFSQLRTPDIREVIPSSNTGKQVYRLRENKLTSSSEEKSKNITANVQTAENT